LHSFLIFSFRAHIEPIPHGVVFDTTGPLYGTTNWGGFRLVFPYYQYVGTVFKLDPATKAFTILHNFTYGDGALPVAGAVFDTTGALYGTTLHGDSAVNQGTVFKLDPLTQVLTTLHVFTGGADGGLPYARLVFDTKGALYGTTSSGGANGNGTVFKLDPTTQVLTTLHAFSGTDGANPQAGLVFDTTGALYGTTSAGGTSNLGTVFKLVP
jgi:uncharacterized repeat protein (TIGR03803 family)